MHYTYDQVVSLSDEEFSRRAIPKADLINPEKFTLSDEEDMEKIERLLDVRIGTLIRGDYYLQHYVSECGRILTMYDFICTAIIDAGHSKSFILHTLVGNKKIVNKMRVTRCSACGRNSTQPLSYSMEVNSYSCGVSVTT